MSLLKAYRFYRNWVMPVQNALEWIVDFAWRHSPRGRASLRAAREREEREEMEGPE